MRREGGGRVGHPLRPASPLSRKNTPAAGNVYPVPRETVGPVGWRGGQVDAVVAGRGGQGRAALTSGAPPRGCTCQGPRPRSYGKGPKGLGPGGGPKGKVAGAAVWVKEQEQNPPKETNLVNEVRLKCPSAKDQEEGPMGSHNALVARRSRKRFEAWGAKQKHQEGLRRRWPKGHYAIVDPLSNSRTALSEVRKGEGVPTRILASSMCRFRSPHLPVRRRNE